MSIVLSRSCMKLRQARLFQGNPAPNLSVTPLFSVSGRCFADNIEKNHDYSNATILVENCLNFQELPVVIRKIKDLTEVCESKHNEKDKSSDSNNYHLIQAEFKECLALRDVFTLLSKCTKITPNIALGAMERIYFLDKNPNPLETISKNYHINFAKGAIVDKLLNVVMKTEDTQTIINIMKVESSFLDQYKENFCDELLLRVADNKLSLDQLCDFMAYLVKNKEQTRYAEIIDKMWVGFIEREHEIDHNKISSVYCFLPAFKDSKRIILSLLEQKMSDLWCHIKPLEMQEILNIYIKLNIWSPQTFALVGRWLNMNLHVLDDDSLLELITKFNKLSYTDELIEKSIEKYVKLKKDKIESPILAVAILNYCVHFQERNKLLMNYCSDYFVQNNSKVPHSFLKSIIYPFGYLYLNPDKNEFWTTAEAVIEDKFDKIPARDVVSIILSFMYLGKYPMKLINKVFSSEYLAKVDDEALKRKLNFIDTSLCLQCEDYAGPLLPKVQWSGSVAQDGRIRNMLKKIQGSLLKIAGGADRMSTSLSIPHLYSDESNLIDVMFHPVGWKLTSAKNGNIAILIHLPEHYCSQEEQLVGPQMMRIRQLKLLGMKVVSLNYATLVKTYSSYNKILLENYLSESIENAEKS